MHLCSIRKFNFLICPRKNEYNIDKRSLFYTSKLITNQLKKGDDYEKLEKTIVENILDFEYFQQPHHFHHNFTLLNPATNDSYQDLLHIHFLELKKYTTLKQMGMIEENNAINKWLDFFTNEDDYHWQTLSERYPIIRKAVNRLKAVSSDKETQYLAEMREKAMRDLISIKEGARRMEEKKESISSL